MPSWIEERGAPGHSNFPHNPPSFLPNNKKSKQPRVKEVLWRVVNLIFPTSYCIKHLAKFGVCIASYSAYKMDFPERIEIAFRNLNDLKSLFPDGEDRDLQELQLEAIETFARRCKTAKQSPPELRKLIANLKNDDDGPSSLFSSSPYVDDLEEKLAVARQLAETGHYEYAHRDRVRPRDVTRFTWAAALVAPVETFRGWRGKIESGEELNVLSLFFMAEHHLPTLSDICELETGGGEVSYFALSSP